MIAGKEDILVGDSHVSPTYFMRGNKLSEKSKLMHIALYKNFTQFQNDFTFFLLVFQNDFTQGFKVFYIGHKISTKLKNRFGA